MRQRHGVEDNHLNCESILGEKTMSLFAGRLQFLSILAENSRKPYPAVMDSELIAGRLNMSLGEIRQLIKYLDDMGVIQSDLEGRLSLITQEGMHWLERYSAC
jgi:predicted transcriptional regulator